MATSREASELITQLGENGISISRLLGLRDDQNQLPPATNIQLLDLEAFKRANTRRLLELKMGGQADIVHIAIGIGDTTEVIHPYSQNPIEIHCGPPHGRNLLSMRLGLDMLADLLGGDSKTHFDHLVKPLAFAFREPTADYLRRTAFEVGRVNDAILAFTAPEDTAQAYSLKRMLVLRLLDIRANDPAVSKHMRVDMIETSSQARILQFSFYLGRKVPNFAISLEDCPDQIYQAIMELL